MNFNDLQAIFADADKAREFLEHLRWGDTPNCPRCGHEGAYKITPKEGSKTRKGLWKCKSCRKPFSVTVGTIFERSHIPLNKWLYAFHAMCSSKKSVSANQLSRTLDLTYKSAWFMCHRIREAMKKDPLKGVLGGIVEADETYVGPKRQKGKRGRGAANKKIVFSMIQRDGEARSVLVKNIKSETLHGHLKANVEGEAQIMTDQLSSYRGLDRHFAAHETVNHEQEYVRGIVHTNFAESYFSLLKRGILGAFHHVSSQHMNRYLAEFDHRWNHRKLSDVGSMLAALHGAEGKRLTYREPVRQMKLRLN